ncbi:MAG: hypothetical protein IPM29_20340 [Planctomycetes bacterium]|nr:hypothetical protein [Planctomycetota bacterium]
MRASLILCSTALCVALPAQSPPPARLLKDVVPVLQDGSDPSGFVEVAGWCYFAATFGQADRELYRTRGTAATTERVADLRPGPGGSDPTWLTEVGGRLMFFADDGVHGRQLYTTDGTAAGTQRIDLTAPAVNARPVAAVAVDGRLVFQWREAGVDRLWGSDGTPVGTLRLDDVGSGVPGDLSLLSGAEPARGGGEQVWLARREFLASSTLWVSDGTAGGTRAIGAVGSGPFTVPMAGTCASAGVFVFEVGGSRSELWVADSSTGAIAPLGSGSYLFGPPVRFDGRAVFPVLDRFGVFAIASDGVSVSTIALSGVSAAGGVVLGLDASALWAVSAESWLVRLPTGGNQATAVGPAPSPAPDTAFIRAGQRFYFEGPQPQRGLFEVDTVSLQWRLAFGGVVPEFGALGQQLLFSGDDGVIGSEPWRITSAVVAPELVADVSPGWQSGDSDPRGFARFGERVAFDAETPGIGREPWLTDGTALGTRCLGDLVPGSNGVANAFHTVGDELWIVPLAGNPRTVHATDGGPQPPSPLARLACDPPAGSPIVSAAAFGAELLFVGTIGPDDGLFVLDRHGSVTRLAALGVDRPALLVNGEHAFVAVRDQGSDDVALWLTDGTPAGTVRLGVAGQGGTPSLAMFDDRVFVACGSGVAVSDGAGVVSFAAWQDAELVAGATRLFGLSSDRIQATDGTPAGSTSIPFTTRPIRRGTGAAIGDRVLFNASGLPHVTDGTVAGTIWFGNNIVMQSVDDPFLPIGPGRAVFAGGYPLTMDYGLFVTDGTYFGTRWFCSTPTGYPGPPGSLDNPTAAVCDGRLYLAGRMAETGSEPYVTDVGAVAEPVGSACTWSVTQRPTLGARAEPRLGTTLQLEAGAAGSTIGTLLLALPAWRPAAVAGTRCALEVDPGTIEVLGPFACAPSGRFAFALPLPADPALSGLPATFQAVLAPAPGPFGASVSAGLRLRLAR